MILKRSILLSMPVILVFLSVLPVAGEGFNIESAAYLMVIVQSADNAAVKDGIVTYEAFGAVGDGVHDDLPAICKAHEYANEHGLCVRSRADAKYHLGRKPMTVIIATDTDWGSSHFIIDDTQVDNHKKSLFEVRSLLGSENIKIDRLKRDQKQLDIRPRYDCYVQVINKSIKRYIRRGLNRNSGVYQRDCFILHRDGSIEGDIDWDYDKISHIEARPIEEKPLVIRGGIFTTIANRMKQEVGYNYWARNIRVTRSNTEVDGLVHHVVGETSVGHPYSGFINVSKCANITLRNCFATGHKTYKTIGAAGKPVSMGSYDYIGDSVVNFRLVKCRMENINDRSLWGVIATNFCKNIELEDCVLSRMDTHMGVSGSYVIRGCTLGYMGINAIGRGLIMLEGSTVHSNSLISLRGDYGSTWQGDVVIRNCRWIPNSGRISRLYMMNVYNDGMHDFGYECFMPREITVDGLYLDDSNHGEGYKGMYFFSDPGGGGNSNNDPDAVKRPFPYVTCEKLHVRGFKAASGKKPRISPSNHINKSIVLIDEDK